MENISHNDLKKILYADLGMNPKAFFGKSVVVTGAGRGIGLHTARAFALLGALVVLAELSEDGLDAERIIQAEGGQAHFIQTDVSSPESVQSLADQTHTLYGPAAVLVNNAIFIKDSGVEEMPLADWDRTIAVNLRGAFLTCRAFLPAMLEMDQGIILNMVSTDAMPGLSAYIASKQGLTGFSKSLALELEGTGLRVIPFAPGMVDTPGIRNVAAGLAPRLGLTEDQFLNLSLHAAYNSLMPPEHAAAAASYLALHLADHFHGELVNGYEVLEKAGFLRTTPVPVGASEPAHPFPTGNLEALLHELAAILAETESEFQQLPVFVRPIAKGGFKRKAGASLADWQERVRGLASGQTNRHPDLGDQLEALAVYYKDVPSETARFTRDEKTLKEITAISLTRVNVIQQIKSHL